MSFRQRMPHASGRAPGHPPARAVALVLQEEEEEAAAAVVTGEMDDVRGQLKPKYDELFGRPGE